MNQQFNLLGMIGSISKRQFNSNEILHYLKKKKKGKSYKKKIKKERKDQTWGSPLIYTRDQPFWLTQLFASPSSNKVYKSQYNYTFKHYETQVF